MNAPLPTPTEAEKTKLRTMMATAVHTMHVPVICKLLDRYPVLADSEIPVLGVDGAPGAPQHFVAACVDRNLVIGVTKALECGFDPNKRVMAEGSTLLEYAVARHRLDLLSLAIGYKADPNLVSTSNISTPIARAINGLRFHGGVTNTEFLRAIDTVRMLMHAGGNPGLRPPGQEASNLMTIVNLDTSAASLEVKSAHVRLISDVVKAGADPSESVPGVIKDSPLLRSLTRKNPAAALILIGLGADTSTQGFGQDFFEAVKKADLGDYVPEMTAAIMRRTLEVEAAKPPSAPVQSPASRITRTEIL